MSNKSIKVRSQSTYQNQEYYLPLKDATLESLLGEDSERASGYFVAEPDWLRNALGNVPANLMELNYLSKRLDSFDRDELATKFQEEFSFYSLNQKAISHSWVGLM